MWLSYFCSRLNIGCVISHFEPADYSFTTVSQDRFFCVLWGGYVLILVQHYKRTFLEPLYKILSIIDFYWLFYFPSGQSLVVPCYARRPLVAEIGVCERCFIKKTDSDFSKEAILIGWWGFCAWRKYFAGRMSSDLFLTPTKNNRGFKSEFPNSYLVHFNPRRMDSEDFEVDFPFT